MATVVLVIVLERRRWLVLAVIGSIAAVLLLVGLTTSIGTRVVGDQFGGGSFSMLADRSEVWSAAISMSVHHPLGVGVDNFYWYYPQFSGRSDQLDHAHNLFLNMLAERGLVGLAAFILFVGALFRVLTRTLQRASRRLDVALLGALIATFAGYLVHSIFEVSYYDYKVLLLFWLLAGVSAALPALQTRQADAEDILGNVSAGRSPQEAWAGA
jgi:O-antigen ligase